MGPLSISRRRVGLSIWPLVALLLALVASLGGPARAATPVFVRADGDDANCNGQVDAPAASKPNCAFQTIAKALGAVDSGGTVNVAAGSYAQAVIVDKPATLRGAKAGVDARTRSGLAGETILAGGVQVNASNVVLDGFLVQNASAALPLNGIGIIISRDPSIAGDQVLNTIVQNNVYGMYLGGGGPAQTLVRHNAFKNNNIAGPGTGVGIFGDSLQDNVLIDANSFSGHKIAAIDLVNQHHENVTISNNSLSNDGPIVLANAANSAIAGNTIDGTSGDAIVLAGSDGGITIRGNQIGQSAGSGVLVTRTPQAVVVNTGIQIVGNALVGGQYGIRVEAGAIGSVEAHFNRIVGNQVAGLQNGAGGAVNAENNWWGCNYTPGGSGAGCAGPFNGTSGPVDVNPWLVLRLVAPKVVAVRGSASLTADVTRNSDGLDTSGAGLLPNGGQVAFAGISGVVVPTSAPLASGQAHAVFTAGPSGNVGRADATFDAQTVSVPIEIVSRLSLYVPLVRR